MYGEKAEQAEELKMDLEDVKSMYKQQVNMQNLTQTPVICCKCNLRTVGEYSVELFDRFARDLNFNLEFYNLQVMPEIIMLHFPTKAKCIPLPLSVEEYKYERVQGELFA